jgi:hypothetical protein
MVAAVLAAAVIIGYDYAAADPRLAWRAPAGVKNTINIAGSTRKLVAQVRSIRHQAAASDEIVERVHCG